MSETSPTECDEIFEIAPETEALLLAVLHYWRDHSNPAQRHPSPLTFDQTGELSKGVLLVENPAIPIAVKILDRNDPSGLLESLIVQELNRGEPPPIAIPDLIDYQPAGPVRLQQLWLSRVDGQKLSDNTVRHFSVAEKQALGQKVGEFVAWMAAALPIERYEQLMDAAGNPVLPDRRHGITYHAERAQRDSGIDPELASVFTQLEADYEMFREIGQLQTPIVGHDDLRIGNLLFKDRAGLWLSESVVDFGIVRPLGPERALRHMAAHGKEVKQAAVAAYEAKTGHTVSEQLLQFWAVGQVAIAAAAYSSVKHWNVAELKERIKSLEYLLPDRDWSGLSAIN